MKNLARIGFMVLSFSVFAQSDKPNNCKPMVIKGESIVIKGTKNKVILINNVTDVDLWITHTVTEPSANAGWASRLQSRNWSSLAVNEFPFTMTCIESRPGHEQEIPCEAAVSACQLTGASLPKDEKRSFWAAEDMPLDSLLAAAHERGIVLPKAK